MLIPIEKVLSKDEVRQFRDVLARATWQDGSQTAGTLARSVKQNQQLDDGSEAAVQLGNHVLRRLANMPTFISAALPKKIYPPKFNRYADGGTYGAHVDSAVMQVPGTNVTVRSDLHRVTPVTRGARIASFFWIESMVGDEGERTLLFDLDEAIQALTPLTEPDDPRLLKLTGVYHNLLRRWAST